MELTGSFSFETLSRINDVIIQINKGPSADEELAEFLKAFLRALRKLVYFDKANFMFFEVDGQLGYYSVKAFPHIGWDPLDIDRYVDSYAQIDDILSVMTEKENIVILNRNLFSKPIDKKSKYYCEFILPQKLSNSIHANFPLEIEDELYAKISLFRDSARRPFTEHDVELIKIFQPHIASLLNKHLVQTRVDDTEKFAQILKDSNSVAMGVVDTESRVLHVNNAFRKWVVSDVDSLRIKNNISNYIQQMCEILKATPCGESTNTDIIIDAIDYHLEMVRYENKYKDVRYICFIYDSSDFLLLKFNRICKENHLTHRECEILSLFLQEGLPIKEVASHLCISYSTAKKHIYSLYQKLGVSSQKELFPLFFNG
jgi:DNA-binding CsgD family transcriptional regulator